MPAHSPDSRRAAVLRAAMARATRADDRALVRDLSEKHAAQRVLSFASETLDRLGHTLSPEGAERLRLALADLIVTHTEAGRDADA